MNTQKLTEALNRMEVVRPVTLEGQPGAFVCPATDEDLLIVYEAASEFLRLMSATPTEVERRAVQRLRDAAEAMRTAGISLIPRPAFAVCDAAGIPRLDLTDVVRSVAREHLACNTVTDQMVERAAKASHRTWQTHLTDEQHEHQWAFLVDDGIRQSHRAAARAALEAALRVEET